MKSFFRYLIIACGLVFFWQLLILLCHLPSYILPSPFRVMIVFYQQIHMIAAESLPTLIETLLGLTLGIIFGCLGGFTIAYSKSLARWCLPLLIILQVIPTFAVAPLLVIWLGYGIASKIVTAMLIIFFPIASAFYDGLRQTQVGWLDLAKTMNARPWRVFLCIRIPAALPSLASGIRIAAVAAPLGAIIGEWVGSSKGLGYLMLNANARMEIDLMFAALFALIVLSLLLYFSVDRLLARLVWW